MTENKFKRALKKSGILEAVPYYNRTGDYYTVIKVIKDKNIIDEFKKNSKDAQIKISVRQYEETGDIWVLKVYN